MTFPSSVCFIVAKNIAAVVPAFLVFQQDEHFIKRAEGMAEESAISLQPGDFV
jgi:hypothetical protein